MLDLRSLHFFITVAERLSVSKAATVLHISQSALSRQIQNLEEALEVRLFDRVGKRLMLTAEGEDLLPRAAALVDQANNLTSRVRSMAKGEVGLLRIGATPQTIEGLLSPILVSLHRKYPAIETTLVEGSNDFLLEQLEEGGAHVAIAALPEQHDFQYQELFMGYLYAVSSQDYPLPAKGSVDIKILTNRPLLLLRKGFMTRTVFDRACNQAGIRPHTKLESDSTQTLISLAAAGHGVAIVSSTAIGQGRVLNLERVVPLTMNGKRLGQMVSAAWNPRRYKSSVLDPFLRELEIHITQTSPTNYPGRSKLEKSKR